MIALLCRSWSVTTREAYAIRPVTRCPVCKISAPLGHDCVTLARLVDHPGTDDLIADLKTAAAAATATTAETPTTT